MSDPALVVSSSNLNTLAGTKRSFAGDAASFPSWRPAKRGRDVTPPGAEVTVPELSARDRPNRGTNITIPYARLAQVPSFPNQRGRVSPGDLVFVDVGPNAPRPSASASASASSKSSGDVPAHSFHALTRQRVPSGVGFSCDGVVGLDMVNEALREARRRGVGGFTASELRTLRGWEPRRCETANTKANPLDAWKDASKEWEKKHDSVERVFETFDERAQKAEGADGVDCNALHRFRVDGFLIWHDEREAREHSSDGQAVYLVAVEGRAQVNNGLVRHPDYHRPWKESLVRSAAPVSHMQAQQPYDDFGRARARALAVNSYEHVPAQMFDRALAVNDVLYVGLFQTAGGVEVDSWDAENDRGASRAAAPLLYYKCFTGRQLASMVRRRERLRKEWVDRGGGGDEDGDEDGGEDGGEGEGEDLAGTVEKGMTLDALVAVDHRADDVALFEVAREGTPANPQKRRRVERLARSLKGTSEPARPPADAPDEFDTITSVEELESLVVAWPLGRVLDKAAVVSQDGPTAAVVHVHVGKMVSAGALGVGTNEGEAGDGDGGAGRLKAVMRARQRALARLLRIKRKQVDKRHQKVWANLNVRLAVVAALKAASAKRVEEREAAETVAEREAAAELEAVAAARLAQEEVQILAERELNRQVQQREDFLTDINAVKDAADYGALKTAFSKSGKLAEDDNDRTLRANAYVLALNRILQGVQAAPTESFKDAESDWLQAAGLAASDKTTTTVAQSEFANETSIGQSVERLKTRADEAARSAVRTFLAGAPGLARYAEDPAVPEDATPKVSAQLYLKALLPPPSDPPAVVVGALEHLLADEPKEVGELFREVLGDGRAGQKKAGTGVLNLLARGMDRNGYKGSAAGTVKALAAGGDSKKRPKAQAFMNDLIQAAEKRTGGVPLFFLEGTDPHARRTQLGLWLVNEALRDPKGAINANDLTLDFDFGIEKEAGGTAPAPDSAAAAARWNEQIRLLQENMQRKEEEERREAEEAEEARAKAEEERRRRAAEAAEAKAAAVAVEAEAERDREKVFKDAAALLAELEELDTTVVSKGVADRLTSLMARKPQRDTVAKAKKRSAGPGMVVKTGKGETAAVPNPTEVELLRKWVEDSNALKERLKKDQAERQNANDKLVGKLKDVAAVVAGFAASAADLQKAKDSQGGLISSFLVPFDQNKLDAATAQMDSLKARLTTLDSEIGAEPKAEDDRSRDSYDALKKMIGPEWITWKRASDVVKEVETKVNAERAEAARKADEKAEAEQALQGRVDTARAEVDKLVVTTATFNGTTDPDKSLQLALSGVGGKEDGGLTAQLTRVSAERKALAAAQTKHVTQHGSAPEPLSTAWNEYSKAAAAAVESAIAARKKSVEEAYKRVATLADDLKRGLDKTDGKSKAPALETANREHPKLTEAKLKLDGLQVMATKPEKELSVATGRALTQLKGSMNTVGKQAEAARAIAGRRAEEKPGIRTGGGELSTTPAQDAAEDARAAQPSAPNPYSKGEQPPRPGSEEKGRGANQVSKVKGAGSKPGSRGSTPRKERSTSSAATNLGAPSAGVPPRGSVRLQDAVEPTVHTRDDTDL